MAFSAKEILLECRRLPIGGGVKLLEIILWTYYYLLLLLWLLQS